MGVVVDESGNACVAGQTASADFPVRDGAFQPDMASDPADYTGDAYVMKLDASGSFMSFAT